MNHQAQTPFNCGPASVAILLGYYDRWVTQQVVNELLPARPGPCRIVHYISAQYGENAKKPSRYQVINTALAARMYHLPLSAADRALPIRALLANGIPAIVLQELSSDSDVSHYRVIKGYDDAAGVFIADDPLLGADHRIPYDTFAQLSSGPPSGRIFVTIHPAEMDAAVESLMADLGVRKVYICRFFEPGP